MDIFENIRIAVFSIKTNLMRSLLTMLGIIIGVASVIAIITVGQGGRDYIVGMIKDMGASCVQFTVDTSVASKSDYVTEKDIEALRNLESVEYVSPMNMTMGTMESRTTSGMAMVMGGVAGCTALLVAGFGLSDSIGSVIANQFESSESICKYDVQIVLKNEQESTESESKR